MIESGRHNEQLGREEDVGHKEEEEDRQEQVKRKMKRERGRGRRGK